MDALQFSRNYKTKLFGAIDSVDLASVGHAIETLRRARDANRHIFVCGNGGSAATASHFVTDMVKGASFNRDSRFRIMALTDSLSTITASFSGRPTGRSLRLASTRPRPT